MKMPYKYSDKNIGNLCLNQLRFSKKQNCVSLFSVKPFSNKMQTKMIFPYVSLLKCLCVRALVRAAVKPDYDCPGFIFIMG